MAKRVWDAEMVARAAGLKRAGFSAKVIAERLGVTEKAVKGRMQKAKVRVRLDGKGGIGRRDNYFQQGRPTPNFFEKPQGEVE